MPTSPGGICIELDVVLDLLFESETETGGPSYLSCLVW